MPRINRSREEWTRIVREFEASGLSAVAFARQHGFSKQSLYKWHSRLRGEARVVTPDFVEIVTEAAKPIMLIMPSGLKLEVPLGTNLGYLRDVVEALQ